MTAITLWLLRHASAEDPAPGHRDFDRALSPIGWRECSRLNRWLRDSGFTPPERVLASPARRTRETAERALAGLSPLPIEVHPELWQADADALRQLINAEAATGGLLLIGHNPGLEWLAGWLGAELPLTGMKPATLLMLRVSAPLQAASAEVLQRFVPSDSM